MNDMKYQTYPTGASDNPYCNPIKENNLVPRPEITVWLESITNNICILDETLHILDEKLNPILGPETPTDSGKPYAVPCNINTDYSKVMANIADRINGFTNKVHSLIERQQIS